jgi:hypothetical protein
LGKESGREALFIFHKCFVSINGIICIFAMSRRAEGEKEGEGESAKRDGARFWKIMGR